MSRDVVSLEHLGEEGDESDSLPPQKPALGSALEVRAGGGSPGHLLSSGSRRALGLEGKMRKMMKNGQKTWHKLLIKVTIIETYKLFVDTNNNIFGKKLQTKLMCVCCKIVLTYF